MTDPLLEQNVNLTSIIGREDPRNGADRVVAFWPGETTLSMGECCDEWFGIDLTAEEVDRLIAWLTERRRFMS